MPDTILQEIVGGTLGMQDNPAPMTLAELDRLLVLMGAYEGQWNQIYAQPGYNADVAELAKGWEAADDMLRISAYASPLYLKMMATFHKGWEPVPAVREPGQEGYDVSQRMAEDVWYLLNDIQNPKLGTHQDFRTVLWNIGWGGHYGYSVQEKVWRLSESGPLNGKWVYRRIVPRHPRQIGFQLDPDTLEVVNFTTRPMPKGKDFIGKPGIVPAEKCALYTYHPFHGLPYGMGDWRPCYKHVFVLNEFMRLWGLGQEKTGIPFPSAVSNTNNAEVMAKQRALLDKMRQSASAVFPPGFVVEWINATAGVAEGWERSCNFHMSAITHLLLYQSLTTNADGTSSFALGEVHEGTQEYAFCYNRTGIASVVDNDLIMPFIRYNYPSEQWHLAPTCSLGEWGLKDKKLKAEIDDIYLRHGVIHPAEEFVRKQQGYPPRQADLPYEDEEDLVEDTEEANA